MVRDTATPDGSTGTTHLAVRATVPASRDAVRRALGPGRAAWLGDTPGEDPAPPGLDRYALDLEMPISEDAIPVALHKAALVDVGPLSEEVVGGPLCVLISWRAATLAPLFPVFSGSLCWNNGELRIDGFYAPPGGLVGAAADRILLRLVAQRTARWLIGRVAVAISAAGRGQSRSSR